MKFFRFGFVISALLCVLMVSAFAAEPEYTYELNGDFRPEYVTFSYDDDMIHVYATDVFIEECGDGMSRDQMCAFFSQLDWTLTVNGVVSSEFFPDWSSGSFSFRYIEDGTYDLSADVAPVYFVFNVTRIPASSDSASVPGILSAVSDVFAAVLGLVALLAAAFAVHPILLIGVVFGFLGVAIVIFRRLFV